jgi:hypothetical protein
MATIRKMQLDKFPHLQGVKLQITTLKEGIEKHIKLIDLSKEKMSQGNNHYEKAKLDVEVWNLTAKLAGMYRKLSDHEIQFKELHTFYSDNLHEVTAKYDEVLKEAKKQMTKNPDIKTEIDKFAGIDFDKNWEAQIHLYATLKKHLYPETTPTLLKKV